MSDYGNYLDIEVDRVVDVESFESSHTTTSLPETVLQFTCEWSIDRTADKIKSAIIVDSRGRVQEFTIRPGPFLCNETSFDEANNIIETALETASPSLTGEVDWYIDHKTSLLRVHIESDDVQSFDTVVSWLSSFLEAYEKTHESMTHKVLRLYPLVPGGKAPEGKCFKCNDNTATCICNARVTENVDDKIVVCDECVEQVMNFSFVYPYMSMGSKMGTVLTGDERGHGRVGAQFA